MRSYGKLMEGVNTPVKKESGDLISRSALIEVLTKYKFGAISNETEREYTKEAVLQFIQTAPTAYNVDKVVEKLEKKKDAMKLLEPSWLSREEKILRHNGYCEGISEAIEIVRKGGVE